MQLKPEELSSVIKKQIENYKVKLETAETGTVIQVADGIARIHGLDNAMQGELLLFPGEVYGMVMNLEEDNVGCVLLGDSRSVSEGDLVKTTGRVVEVPVGDALLGRVVSHHKTEKKYFSITIYFGLLCQLGVLVMLALFVWVL